MRRGAAWRARLSGWMLVVRVLTLSITGLMTGELSGLAHAATDLCETLAGREYHHADCDDEEPGHECPPGCPNCHCAHAAVILTTPLCEASLEPLPRPGRVVGFVPYAALVPSGADAASVYRPPRLHA